MTARSGLSDPRVKWMDGEIIRPYVFLRGANKLPNPGRGPLNWFPWEPLIKDPQRMHEQDFTSQILNLENNVFGATGLAMPRWVFYDCAIMPGLTTGFAVKASLAPAKIKEITRPSHHAEWVPLSLFCVIPTMNPGEWVAHNLSSVNSALPEAERYYGLGFLSKAFGLWYANIQSLCGMTQWKSPAIRLHSHYGDFEVQTAYTPSHSYAQTLTYRLIVNYGEFGRFFSHQPLTRFRSQFEPAGLQLNRNEETSLKAMQGLIESGAGPFYLDADEIRDQALDSVLSVYRPKV